MDFLKKIRLWRGLEKFVNNPVVAKAQEPFRGVINRVASVWTPDQRKRPAPFVLYTKPLAESRVAVVTTAGLYLEGDEPFDTDSGRGDASFRHIPTDFDKEQIRIAHSHYSHQRANEDINVLVPIDNLRALADHRVIAGLTENIYSFGFGGGLVKEYVGKNGTAHRLAELLKNEGADLVLLAPA